MAGRIITNNKWNGIRRIISLFLGYVFLALFRQRDSACVESNKVSSDIL